MSFCCTKRGGFAILIVLVAVAVMMMLYFVQIDTLFGPGPPNERAGLESHPWVLEGLLVPDNENVKLPRKPKLQWDDPFDVTAPVQLNGTDRGKVRIAFNTAGRIEAAWKCIYTSDSLSFQISSQMTGNIDAKRTYRDETGKDKSRLFFIAKGSYNKVPTEANPSAAGEHGTAWLTGWISANRSLQGHVTITTDQTWAGVYTFETGR